MRSRPGVRAGGELHAEDPVAAIVETQRERELADLVQGRAVPILRALDAPATRPEAQLLDP